MDYIAYLKSMICPLNLNKTSIDSIKVLTKIKYAKNLQVVHFGKVFEDTRC